MTKDTVREIARISGLKSVEYSERGISKETMERFGVKVEMSERDGQPYAHYYPYHEEDGTISGYKCRILPKDFSAGVTGKLKGFFGKKQLKQSGFLIIVEGEQDVLAGYEIMSESKYKPYNIVSVPLGADENGTLDSAIKKELDWLLTFKKICICLDSDKAGRATANALADALCSSVDVRIAQLPLKDTAKMWESGRGNDWMDAIFNAHLYVSDQIVVGDEGSLGDLLTPLKRGIEFSFIPETSSKLRGFREGELTTIIAPPKVGKSSLLRQKDYEILNSTDEVVGGLYLEETAVKTKQAILAMHAKIALNTFRADPSKADKHLVEEAYETLLPRYHLFQHKNRTITDDVLMRKIEYMVKGLGCKTVTIDHTTFVTGTRETNNERRDIDMMLTKLARMVEDEKFRLFIVAHLKRAGRERLRTDESQDYPYWEMITMQDARGSGAFEQLSHVMLALEKQHLDPNGDNTRGMVRTRILAAREWGIEGVGDYLDWDSVSGSFNPVGVEL